MKALYKQKSIDELKTLINASKTWQEVMYKLGYTANRGNSYYSMKKYINELNIDTTHLGIKNKNRYSHPTFELSEILVANSKYTNMTRLKKRILSNNLLENKCYICGINSWNDKPLILQLDHINGNNRDNRIENLRLLCPNCHSQTETFSGKNIKKMYKMGRAIDLETQLESV